MATANSVDVANAFIGSASAPGDSALRAVLGDAKAAWDELLSWLQSEFGADKQEWKSYSAKSGWALRVSRGKRTIVWLSPCPGCLFAGIILGPKAIAAAQAALSASLLRTIAESPKYPEGTGVRLTVRRPAGLAKVKKLIAVKMAN